MIYFSAREAGVTIGSLPLQSRSGTTQEKFVTPMSISSISANGAVPANYASDKSAIKPEFKALAAALKSGNMEDAKQAFAVIQKDAPGKVDADDSAKAGTSSKAQDPMAALSQALQSGNLAAAQSAFSTLQTKHGRHAHHRGALSATAAAPSTSPTVTPSTNPTSNDLGNGVGGNVNLKL
jgi:hypothetical protein